MLLSVEVEEELVQQSLQKAYRHLVNKKDIPGFRRGKAPRAVLERLIGRKALMEKALDDLLPQLYDQAVKEQGVEPIAHPRLEVVQEEPLIFKAVVPLRPQVELSDYRQIRVVPEPIQVTEEAVQSFLRQLRWDTAPWEPATGPAKMGDLLVLDLKAEEEGVLVLERKGLRYLVAAEAGEPAPGLAEHLVGMEKGQSRQFHLAYPPDYSDPAWAGRKIDFHAQVLEIKEKVLPPLDDEFAKGVGDDFDGLEALRQHVRKLLEERAQAQARSRLEEQVVQAVVAGARVEFPPLMAEQEVEAMLEELKARVAAQGITFSQYLRFTGKDEGQLWEEFLPTARERVKRRLVLDRVAEAEEITVGKDEVEAEIEEVVKRASSKGEELRDRLATEAGLRSVERVLRTRKTVERLVALAAAEELSPLEEAEEPSQIASADLAEDREASAQEEVRKENDLQS